MVLLNPLLIIIYRYAIFDESFKTLDHGALFQEVS
jgi:hypothetical protein